MFQHPLQVHNKEPVLQKNEIQSYITNIIVKKCKQPQLCLTKHLIKSNKRTSYSNSSLISRPLSKHKFNNNGIKRRELESQEKIIET